MNGSDIRYYLSRFWSRFPLFVLLALVPAVAGIALAWMLPPVYRSAATILVEGAQIPTELATTTVQTAAQEQVRVIEQRMMTRDNLLGIADRFDLFPDEDELSPTDRVDAVRAATTFEVISLSSSRTGEGTIAFTIGFHNDNPVLASRVANEYVTMILDLNVRLRTEAAQDTLAFFNQESERLIRELSALESEIVRFKNENAEALPESLEFRREQTAALQDQLIAVTREEIELSQLLFQLEQAQTDPEFALTLEPEDSPQQQQLDEMRRELVQQKAIFSESHPNVLALESRIKAVEAMIAATPDTTSDDPAAGQTSIEVRLTQTEERLDLIRVQKAELQARIDSLNQTIKDTPRVEMALNILQRNYANLQLQYDNNSQALAEAAQGEKLELRQKGQRFSVLEQAVQPTEPISPNRPLIAAGGIAAGLILGAGVALVLELLNRTVHRSADVARRLGIETLANVPYIFAPGEIARRRLMRLAVACGILALIPAALFAIDSLVMPVDELASQLTARLGAGE
jgi:polysaccharide chain length determinant protein (PEP-CTERM system associated)